MIPKRFAVFLCAAFSMLAGLTMASGLDRQSVLPNLPPQPSFVISTVALNGDQNPYGVAFVPRNFPNCGSLSPGDILVSNFNNSANAQGTGSTIMRLTAGGAPSVFFQAPPGVGLTTALGVLRAGFIIVGSVPAPTGTAQQGQLIFLDAVGNEVEALTDSTLLAGPWDLAIHDEGDQAQVFVSNVLSGTVTRIDLEIPMDGNPIVLSETQIASGFAHRTDPVALVVGPTGLVYEARGDALYVASTADNAIFAIPNARRRSTDASTGNIIYQDNLHLHGPLGLVPAPNGDLITTNGDAVNPDPTQPNEMVEFTVTGQFVAEVSVDTLPLGAAFGIALTRFQDHIRLVAVDDNTNSVKVWDVCP